MAAHLSWSTVVVFLATVAASSASLYYGSPYLPVRSPVYYPSSPPALTVLAERPYTVEPQLNSVPLVVVGQETLNVVQNAHISAVSPTQPLVTVQLPQHTTTEAMPAVRVVLRKPIYVSSLHSTIAFPAGFTVVHDGLRMPIPVGAVIAPVPTGTVLSPNRPFAVNVVYAVPTGPIPIQYPFYQTYPVHRPISHPTQRPIQTITSPRPTSPRPPVPQRPISQDQTLVVGGRPRPPLVSILDFPNTVASPPIVFYQPPATDLINREPPQPVVPAGIVQSTAPEHNLSVFVNSKESPYLQILREEAERNRNRPQF